MMIIAISIGLLGIITGWLVNYLSDTLPATRRIQKPICLQCGAKKDWKEYFLFKPCKSCGASAPITRYIIVMTLGGISSLWFWFHPSARMSFPWIWALLVYAGTVAVIDIEHRVVLNEVSLTGVVFGAALGIQLHGWLATLIGGAVGFAIMFGLFYLGEFFSKWLAKRRGETVEEVALGFGDVNLAGVVGLMLGWPGIVAGLFLTIFLAGVFSLILVVIQIIGKRYSPNAAIPYAPFIISGTLLLLLK